MAIPSNTSCSSNQTKNYYINKALINSIQGWQKITRKFQYGSNLSPLEFTAGNNGKLKFTYTGNKFSGDINANNPSGYGLALLESSGIGQASLDATSNNPNGWFGKKVVEIKLKFTPTNIPTCNGQPKTINFDGITSPNDGNSYVTTIYTHTHAGGNYGNNAYPPPVPGPVGGGDSSFRF